MRLASHVRRARLFVLGDVGVKLEQSLSMRKDLFASMVYPLSPLLFPQFSQESPGVLKVAWTVWELVSPSQTY